MSLNARIQHFGRFGRKEVLIRVVMLNDTFNDISVLSRGSVLLEYPEKTTNLSLTNFIT